MVHHTVNSNFFWCFALHLCGFSRFSLKPPAFVQKRHVVLRGSMERKASESGPEFSHSVGPRCRANVGATGFSTAEITPVVWVFRVKKTWWWLEHEWIMTFQKQLGIFGNFIIIIIPSDSVIFQRGRYTKTTNQFIFVKKKVESASWSMLSFQFHHMINMDGSSTMNMFLFSFSFMVEDVNIFMV